MPPADETPAVDPWVEDLRSQVTETVGVMDSAKTLIEGFAGVLVRVAGDKEATLAVAAQMKAASDALAAAVQASPPPGS